MKKIFNIRLSDEDKQRLAVLSNNAGETKTTYIVKSIKLREWFDSIEEPQFTSEEIERAYKDIFGE